MLAQNSVVVLNKTLRTFQKSDDKSSTDAILGTFKTLKTKGVEILKRLA